MEKSPIDLFVLVIFSMNSIVQPFVRHLIVKRRLTNEKELLILARQFPNVEYLKLLFPLENSYVFVVFKHYLVLMNVLIHIVLFGID
jgi:hypothetical protein